MKLAIITILIICLSGMFLAKYHRNKETQDKGRVVTSTSSASSSSSISQKYGGKSWSKYIQNIDLKLEPIEKEWISECVKGFPECNFQGESAELCEGIYKFIVFSNEVRPDSGTPTNALKSLKVPKGFKIETKGIFQKKFFNTTDASVLSQIQYLQENDFKINDVRNTDFKCIIPNSFWRGIITVSSNDYIRITKLMPSFVRYLIFAQTAKYNQGDADKNFFTCKNKNTAAQQVISQTEAEILKMTHTKNEYETTIKTREIEIQQFEKIVSGEIKTSHWVKEGKQFKEEIEDLKQENTKYNKLITEYQKKITAYNKGIEKEEKSKRNLNEHIIKLKEEIIKTETNIDQQTNALKNFETDRAIKMNAHMDHNQANNNLIAEKEEIEEKIKDLQRRKMEIDIVVKKNNNQLAEMESEVMKFKDVTTKKTEEINVIRKSKTALEAQISTSNAEITNIDMRINNYSKEIEKTLEAINTVSGNLNKNLVKIKRKTHSAIEQTKDFYRKEIVNKKTESSTNTKLLESTISLINSKKAVVTQSHTELISNMGCIESNTRERNKWATEYDSNMKMISKIIQDVKILYDDVEGLKQIIDMLNETQPPETWLATAKTNLHNYLDQIPADPKAAKEIEESFDRRRKFRKLF